MTVRIEKKDRVTTVILDRPEKRNAVDRATATALASVPARLPQAMANEFKHGQATLAGGEWLEGAARFGKGEGKHGTFT